MTNEEARELLDLNKQVRIPEDQLVSFVDHMEEIKHPQYFDLYFEFDRENREYQISFRVW